MGRGFKQFGTCKLLGKVSLGTFMVYIIFFEFVRMNIHVLLFIYSTVCVNTLFYHPSKK